MIILKAISDTQNCEMLHFNFTEKNDVHSTTTTSQFCVGLKYKHITQNLCENNVISISVNLITDDIPYCIRYKINGAEILQLTFSDRLIQTRVKTNQKDYS